MRKTEACSPGTEPALTADDYRLFPGALATAFCPDCGKEHRGYFPKGLTVETFFISCPICKGTRAEIVRVEEEGVRP